MIHTTDLLQIAGVIAAMVLMVFVIRARRRGKSKHDLEYAGENVCEHLKPAFDALLARGHGVKRVGQHGPDMPLEIHMEPAFDPAALLAEFKLEAPVFLSERNVLYCKEDWCELHPIK